MKRPRYEPPNPIPIALYGYATTILHGAVTNPVSKLRKSKPNPENIPSSVQHCTDLSDAWNRSGLAGWFGTYER